MASPEWSLEQAAETMFEHGFRHLLVVNGGELRGVLSMRDIVRCWALGPRARLKRWRRWQGYCSAERGAPLVPLLDAYRPRS